MVSIKDFVNRKALDMQNKHSEMLEKMLVGTMEKKVERLRKEGKPITLENLMNKWEALGKVGLGYDDVKAVASKYVEMENLNLDGKVAAAEKELSKVSFKEGRKRLFDNIKAEFLEANKEQRAVIYSDYTRSKSFMALWAKYDLGINQLQGFIKDGRNGG